MSQSAALFVQTPKSNPRHLLQFKAGKLSENDKHLVSADPRKGWAYMYLNSDGKLNFCWIDRKTRMVEDNFVIPAKSADFSHVVESSTGRVYLLKMADNRRFFIWMQETNEKDDANICNRVNGLIKNPPAPIPTTNASMLGSLQNLSQLTQNEILTLLSMGLSPTHLSSDSDVSSAQAIASTIGRSHLNAPGQMLSSTVSSKPTRPSNTAPNSQAPASNSTADSKFQLSDLRNMISSVSNASGSVDLSSVLNIANLGDTITRPDVVKRLLPHLPPCDADLPPASDSERVTANIRSASFKATLSSFSSAFREGVLAPVLMQFKLGDQANAAALHGDMLAFSQALQEGQQASASNSTSGGAAIDTDSPETPMRKIASDSSKKNDDDDDETPMETDD